MQLILAAGTATGQITTVRSSRENAATGYELDRRASPL